MKRLWFSLPALLLFFCGGCSLFRGETASPELAGMGFRALSGSPGVFVHPAGVLKLTPGKRTCLINGMQFFLPHAVQLDERGRYCVTALSIAKVIQPLFSGQPITCPVRTVIIDPGHGGDDLGAKGLKFKEKELNLALAKAVAEALKKRGFNVRMTRMNDKFLTLDQRGKLAHKGNGDLFLSIHHNAAANKNSNGVETYIVTPGGAASSNDKEEQIHKKSVSANCYDTVNIRLAALIQQNMVRKTAAADRGVRFARFRVLALSQLPGALIEAGFVSHPAEELQCGSAQRQRKIAEAIADAVTRLNSNR